MSDRPWLHRGQGQLIFFFKIVSYTLYSKRGDYKAVSCLTTWTTHTLLPDKIQPDHQLYQTPLLDVSGYSLNNTTYRWRLTPKNPAITL
jgi:hypothetical protein